MSSSKSFSRTLSNSSSIRRPGLGASVHAGTMLPEAIANIQWSLQQQKQLGHLWVMLLMLLATQGCLLQPLL